MFVKIPRHEQREDNGTQGGTNPRGGVLIFAGTNPCGGGGAQTLLGWYVCTNHRWYKTSVTIAWRPTDDVLCEDYNCILFISSCVILSVKCIVVAI